MIKTDSLPLATLKERLHELALFLPKFEDAGFTFGEWAESK